MNSNKIIFIILIIISVLFTSCKLSEEEPKPVEIYGCMDSTATNYNPEATIDDGSCDYCKEGSSFILLSTDGGSNWSIRCLQEKAGGISDISMIDSNNIWLCTTPNSLVSKVQIIHTADGGRTWEEQLFFDSILPTQISFEYIEMFDLNNGIALANDWNNLVPMFLKTTDGGDNWIQTTSEAIGISGDIWRRVDFVDINIGYFFESIVNPQKLYKTTDSGNTWQETNFDGYAQVLKFYNEDIGIIANWNKIYRTLDGGNNWTQTDSLERGWGIDIEFAQNDPSKVWLLADGLFFSSDTGFTWDLCIDKRAGAIQWSNSSLWVYNLNRYLRKVDINDCANYVEYVLPEYSQGNLILGDDFDIVGDIIVIPGQIM